MKFVYKTDEFVFSEAIKGNESAIDALIDKFLLLGAIEVYCDEVLKRKTVQEVLIDLDISTWDKILKIIKEKSISKDSTDKELKFSKTWMKNLITKEVQRKNWVGLKEFIRFDGNFDFHKEAIFGFKNDVIKTINNPNVYDEWIKSKGRNLEKLMDLFLDEDDRVKSMVGSSPETFYSDSGLGKAAVQKVFNENGNKSIEWLSKNAYRIQSANQWLDIARNELLFGDIDCFELALKSSKNLPDVEGEIFLQNLKEVIEEGELHWISGNSVEEQKKADFLSRWVPLRVDLVKNWGYKLTKDDLETQGEEIAESLIDWFKMGGDFNDIFVKNHEMYFGWVKKDYVVSRMLDYVQDNINLVPSFLSREEIGRLESAALRLSGVKASTKKTRSASL